MFSYHGSWLAGSVAEGLEMRADTEAGEPSHIGFLLTRENIHSEVPLYGMLLTF